MPGDGFAGLGEVSLHLLERMTGAALLGLENKLHAGRSNDSANPLGLVADDAVDLCRWDDSLRRVDNVQQEGLAAYLVQNFGALTLEPRPLARSHDGDRKSGNIPVSVHR